MPGERDIVEQFTNRVLGMADRLGAYPWRASPLSRPFSVGIVRGMGEGLLGSLILLLLGVLIDQLVPGAQFILRLAGALCYILSLLWLAVWPAWRMHRPGRRPWFPRLVLGPCRLVVYGILLGLSSAVIVLVAHALPGDHGARVFLPGFVPLIFFIFFPLRVALVTGAGIRRWAGRRLRRQLTLSHLVVVLIAVFGLVSLGGIGALALLISLLPVAGNQATVVAAAVQPAAGQPLRHDQVQTTLSALLNQELRPGAITSAPLLAIIPWSAVNRRALVADEHGRVIGATRNQDFARQCPSLTANAPLPPPVWNYFLREALAGHGATAPVPRGMFCGNNIGEQRFAEAPIYNAAHQPIGMAVVQGGEFFPTTKDVVGVLVVGVTAATLAVLFVAVLPTVAVSTLVSYVFARGITRRLIDVSQAASAIAAGDLTRRAPMTARNEIGRLAEDFNRMAAHMEAAMTELRVARAQAEGALRAREELVANVSHELRTPIAVVQAHLESLQLRGGAAYREPVLVPEETLEALHQEMERLTALVDDLFSLARAGTGALQVRVEPTDVAALVREQGGLLRPLVQRQGAITLSVEAPPGLPLAMADSDRLRQILANLIRNAARHTPEGGIIALAVATEDPWIVVTVADTGEGIAPEHLPHIFERFYRADSARSRASGGAGLGLAIVSEFVRLMGGQVTAASTLGEGSCFRVYLPMATSASGAPARTLTDSLPIAHTTLRSADTQAIHRRYAEVNERNTAP
ncbi:MAG TPA: ATP-binding protein [Chloroflexota bacterium]|nr:ATP-binding protein [Chloroflexota bacterium]